MKGNTPTNELQMYTWQDASLKELEGLVKEVNPEARRRGTYFDFALVYPDLRQGPRCQTRDVGTYFDFALVYPDLRQGPRC